MPRILDEDKWETIWLASTIMTYKLSMESEHKAVELDKMREVQMKEMKEINKKLDLIIKYLETLDK